MITAFVHGTTKRADGSIDSMFTRAVEIEERPLSWQRAGRQFTRSGYGSKIPTAYMVKFNGKWRRVYCCVWSNSGTLYIGNLRQPETLIVQINA